MKSNILGVAKIAKDVAKSKLGKILITAAIIYFGGAALAGGFGSAGAGGSFLTGMGTGVSSAASGLSSAWSATMAGEFGQAASTVGNAWGTAGSAAASEATAAQAAQAAAAAGSTTGATTGGAMGPQQPMPPTNAPVATGPTTAPVGGGPAMPSTTPAPASGMTVGEGLMGAAKIQAGTAIIGGAMQGKAAQDQQEDQRAYEMEQARLARERYNENAGARLFSDQQPVSGGYSTPSGAYAYDPLAEANAVSNRRINEYNARQGLVSRNMA